LCAPTDLSDSKELLWYVALEQVLAGDRVEARAGSAYRRILLPGVGPSWRCENAFVLELYMELLVGMLVEADKE
jgi:hypothetical protein